MNFEHVSVMLMPTVDMLDVREGGVYVDGTLGGGGHSAEILRRLNGTGHLYGIDRDNDALAAATERLGAAGNFTAVKGNFHDVKALLAERGVEKIEQLPLTPRRQGGKALAGEVTETSKKRTLTEKEFSILRRHTRRKLTELAGELLQGHAEVSPMHTTNVDACKYCKYSSVCGFEGAKNEGKMDNDEVLAYLRREDRDA